MDISSPEFARRAGISERRVQKLIADRRIKASKVAGNWIIDESELLKRRPIGRPMSPRMARALLQILSGDEMPKVLDPSEKSRLRKRVEELRQSKDAPEMLNSLLANRAIVHSMRISPRDLSALFGEKLIMPSGISDPRVGISDLNFFEGYVDKKDLPKLMKKYLLVKSENPNVILRESKLGDPREIAQGMSLADLAEHNESRAEIKLRELLSKL